MIFNINQIATVVLTNDGRNHYRDHLLTVYKTLPAKAKDKMLREELPDDEGRVTMPLWRIFDVFGHLNGPKPLIVGGNIEVAE